MGFQLSQKARGGIDKGVFIYLVNVDICLVDLCL